jgi:hypothetical protein
MSTGIPYTVLSSEEASPWPSFSQVLLDSCFVSLSSIQQDFFCSESMVKHNQLKLYIVLHKLHDNTNL